jgi:exocyst complex component 7
LFIFSGEEAGELDSFVRFLVMRLLNSLKGKALNYVRDGRDDSQAKSNLFLINNCFFLLEELGHESSYMHNAPKDNEHYRIEGSWFIDKVNKILESEKTKYLGHWEILNTHLTAIGKDELEFQKSETLLTVESGRLLKNRFSGFNDDFERTSALHQKLCVIDPRLRAQMQQEVKQVFIPRYERFYHKYKKYRFSKKKQENYTKYSPQKIEEVIRELYTAPVR